MSFFDMVSGFFEGVSSFISEVSEKITVFLKDVSESVKEIMSDLGPFLGPALNVICIATTVALMVAFPELDIVGLVIAIGEICSLVTTIAESVSSKPTEEHIDAVDLAMRAEKSDAKREDFDSYDEYIYHLSQTIEADKERMENLSDSEKMAYSLAGLAIREKQISEDLKVDVKAETYVDAYKANMTSEELKGLIGYASENKMTEMPRLGDYFEGEKLDRTEQTEMRNGLYEAIKSSNPEMSDAEINTRIHDMKETYNSGTES